ncbi:hypothetical protein [Staphylococcus chromogenes]|uniref:hypothetical protein n=1 Tax=Staphylococcus chromogenes TaxID=46126 RepID=UPI0021D03AE3|nr:hypothetical protein [Staphylococcus chromogenes]UXS76351.1 hypothetical protein MUA20_04795 [Staphylococcus chromogenes]
MINKTIINKARTFEKKLGKQKWNKFKELLLQTKYKIVHLSDSELFLKIPGEERADIEIFPIYELNTWDQSFIHIQLWFYDFKTDGFKELFDKKEKHQHNNIVEALNYINFILSIIQEDKRLYEQNQINKD